MGKLRNRRVVAGLAGAVVAAVAAGALAITGNIDPHVIQIDGNPNGADLYPDMGVPLNGGDVDWVADNLDNTGTNCLATSGDNADVATCNQAGVTAASGGTGHWNGVRIVDGFGRNDQDIFLQGGKENDTSTWDVGGGSVGSSKYDVTEAYLANDASDLFFGMERRGNDGTTAFDFEFNALPPKSTYIPTRSVGDVLFSFLLSGSSTSGTAQVYVFLWNGSTYVQQSTLPSGTWASINNVATPAGPWGYADSKGNWALGDLPNFEFAEAAVPIGPGGVTLPGVNPCGGTAYVNIRTRSSVTDTSDLKDTTRIFKYVFAGLTASASKTSASADGTTANLSSTVTGSPTSYQWQVYKSGAWTNISGATASTLAYSGFTTDNTSPTTGVTFSISNGDAGVDNYVGAVYPVQLRVVVSKTVGSDTCTAESSAVTVKQVIGADP